MGSWMLYSCFVLSCLVSMSEQCKCYTIHTQSLVCEPLLVVLEAKIESFSETNNDTNYQISVKKIYKGEGIYSFSDGTTLKTPKNPSACGPVVLKVGSSYILSVFVHDDNMHLRLCDIRASLSNATNALLEGMSGKYLEICRCQIPSIYAPAKTGPRTKHQCGDLPLACNNYDTICSRDNDGQCNWQDC
ncbi:uncharacterized protein LOC134719673 [Mytilus trossulus]|uniref:uncharacterized protein LOC134719673 n=1 Tax=Mytilus trossulus TaxID=6551 RepID=UPI0030043A30